MAGRIAYYGNIVKDGLIFNLDAAKVDSYPGSGTTWRDISGFQNSASLTNGPTFNTSNGGSIVFDGVNDHAVLANGTFGYSPGTTGELTLEVWVFPTGPFTSYVAEPPTTNLGGILGQGYFDNSIGWGIGMVRSSGVNYFAFQVRNLGTAVTPALNAASSFATGSWYHVVGSLTRNNFSRLYINGQLASSGSSTSLNNVSITPNNNNAAIGRAGNFYTGCQIPSARLYNKALTQAEVLQNYNATKGRYGL
jgi:hypothetical protein